MSLDDYTNKKLDKVYIGDTIQMEIEIYNITNFFIEDNETPKDLESIYNTAKIEHQMEVIILKSNLLKTNIPTIYEKFIRDIIKELYESDTKYTFEDLREMLLPYIIKITDMTEDALLNSKGIEKINYDNDILQSVIHKYTKKPQFYDIYVLILFRSLYDFYLQQSKNKSLDNKKQHNTDKYKIESTASGISRKEKHPRNNNDDVDDGYKNKPDISDAVKNDYDPKIKTFNDIKSQYNSRGKVVEIYLKNIPNIFNAYKQYRKFSRDIIFELFNSDLKTREDVIEYLRAYLSNESADKNLPVLNNYLNNFPDVYINVFVTTLKNI